ncbi:RHS repeat-associated core domain-containing protein [Paludibaculum fermentans]|uniref:ParB N-terminal domain-containing protein n=1 Tax=Paludibaculum fermentans TaxID=1473598 RepID=A0A7S7SJC1_PALFE|nr:RHS repeat-associated core domain-containing protein [Paludibaculum fermentans]QOY87922.1 ParB N-terminal domain-containing protein [Paludibaculum fermentans]
MATHTLTTGEKPCLQPFCDGLANRLTRAAETLTGTTAWIEVFGYDWFGNQRVSSVCPSGLTESSILQAKGNFGTIKRLQGNSAVYDPEDSGNQTAVVRCASSYNIGQRWKSATFRGNTTTYSYDDGDRRKTKAWRAVASVYVYDRESALAGKYNSVAGSQHRTPASIIPRQDHLPSESELAPAIAARPHSCPGADAVSHRFTGKERDAETGLDYFGARYFSGAQGRFTSPDLPFADQNSADPQSWNLYSYARNNPLRYMDPTGRAVCFNKDLASCSDSSNPDEVLRDEPKIGPLPISRGNPQRERAVGVVKGFLTDIFELMRLGGAPDANVDQAEHALGLSPSSKNEEFGVDLGGILGLLTPGGGERQLVKTWELTATHELTKSKRAFSALKESISKEGIKETVKYVEYEGKKFIVDGHHRVEAAKQLGIREVPAQQVTLPYKGYLSPTDLH